MEYFGCTIFYQKEVYNIHICKWKILVVGQLCGILCFLYSLEILFFFFQSKLSVLRNNVTYMFYRYKCQVKQVHNLLVQLKID